MRFIYTIITILVLTALITWLNYRLLSRLFRWFRSRAARLCLPSAYLDHRLGNAVRLAPASAICCHRQ